MVEKSSGFATEDFQNQEVTVEIVERVVVSKLRGTCVDINQSGVVIMTEARGVVTQRFIPHDKLHYMEFKQPLAKKKRGKR